MLTTTTIIIVIKITSIANSDLEVKKFVSSRSRLPISLPRARDHDFQSRDIKIELTISNYVISRYNELRYMEISHNLDITNKYKIAGKRKVLKDSRKYSMFQAFFLKSIFATRKPTTPHAFITYARPILENYMQVWYLHDKGGINYIANVQLT